MAIVEDVNARAYRSRFVIDESGVMEYSDAPLRQQERNKKGRRGWSQSKLARAAGVGLATLQRIEQNEGVVKGNFSTILKIQKVLEQAGIQFDDDQAGEIGVRLQIGKR